LSTEEDGVDEAGRSTHPPLIMAPPSLKVDPDEETTDVIVDNGIMSSPPRTKTERSRSEASRRAEGANGDSSPSGDSVTSGDPADAAAPADAATSSDTVATDTAAPDASADSADEKPATAASSTEVPLPAETIGKVKGRAPDSSASTGDNGRGSERPGGRQAMSSGESVWATSQKAATAPKPAEPADSATTAAAGVADAAASSAVTSPRPSTPSAAPTRTSSTYSGPSRPGTGASYQATAYAPPAGYPGPGSQGAGGTPQTGNGSSSSNGFSAGTASAAAGAAAGRLASSVTSAWQRRGNAKGVQTRKATKRQAMLTLARVEPWSVMKFSFVASAVAFVILFVAVAVLYMVLSALGVFDSLQNTVSSVTSSQNSSGTNISHWFSASLILGYTAMLGALNIVLITAMSTVGSVIYNLIAKTIGGIEVTLRETD
jgi:hypothetical protein